MKKLITIYVNDYFLDEISDKEKEYFRKENKTAFSGDKEKRKLFERLSQTFLKEDPFDEIEDYRDNFLAIKTYLYRWLDDHNYLYRAECTAPHGGGTYDESILKKSIGRNIYIVILLICRATKTDTLW